MDALDATSGAVVRALCRYWVTHPRACDGLDGIARWWLSGVRVSTQTLEQALEVLQRQGVAEVLNAADGRQRWRRRDGVDDAVLRKVAADGPGP